MPGALGAIISRDVGGGIRRNRAVDASLQISGAVCVSAEAHLQGENSVLLEAEIGGGSSQPGRLMEGWTKEEEKALHQAHLEVTPAEDFWVQVAKKLPGRTAKECRVKYFSAYPTPPQQQPRIPRRSLSSPVRALIDAALFSDDDIPEGKKRKQRSRKPTATASRKSMRKAVKEAQSDEDENADASAARKYRRASENRMPLADMDANKRALRPGQAQQGRQKENLKAVPGEGPSRQTETGTPEVLRRTVDQKQLDRYLKVLHKQKRQDKVRANDRSKRKGAAAKIAAKAVEEANFFCFGSSDTASIAEEVLQKCFELRSHQSDAIDHTFDEESGGELEGESDADDSA